MFEDKNDFDFEFEDIESSSGAGKPQEDFGVGSDDIISFDEWSSKTQEPDEDIMAFANMTNRDISSRSQAEEEEVNLYTGGNEGDAGQVSLASFLEDDETSNSKKKSVKQNAKHENLSKNEKTKVVLKRIGKIALTCMLIFVITAAIGIGTGVVWLMSEEASGKFNMDEYDLESSLDFTTTIYVQNDEGEYVPYEHLHGEFNRIWVDIDDIPQNLENAFIAIEDKRFREHSGVDWKRTAYAFINSFLNVSGRQGGSTITQQLVKNLTGDNEISARRKVDEIMKARYLEENYSKDSILEWYLNTIPMGTGLYGVEVAANYYFGKTCQELSIAECASLASITQNPESHRPDLEANEKAHLSRRNTVLEYMYDQEFITEKQYEKAVATKLKVVGENAAKKEKQNSDFETALIEEVIEMLVTKKKYDKNAAEMEFYNGGYKIYSTLKPEVQKALEEVYSDESYFSYPLSAKDGKSTPQSCMTITDYEGHIVGIIGGKGDRSEGERILNRAISSPRQIGSCMKPIGVYALGIDRKAINYSSFISDRQLSWNDPSIEGRWPNNWDFAYIGNVSVEYAIYHSVNCSPVYVLRELIGDKVASGANSGLTISYEFLKNKLGLSHLVEQDKTFSSLCLGGCAYGATSTEMAAAYSVFGNLGKYYKPTTYTVIKDQFDNVIDDNTNRDPTIAIREGSATVMNHLLRSVVSSKGTGAGAKVKGFDTFAKTGTTSDSQDLWFCGGTPYYVGATWYGFDNPGEDSPNGMIGTSAEAKNIWKAVMDKIHEDLPEKEFVDSEYAEELKYCVDTGKIATKYCKKKAKGWYRTDDIPETCDRHKKGKGDKDKDKDEENEKTESESDNTTSSEATSSNKKPSSSASASSGSQSVSSAVSSKEETVSSAPAETTSSEATSTTESTVQQTE